MKRILITILLLNSIGFSFSQKLQLSDSTKAKNYFSLADKYFSNQKYDSSSFYFRKSAGTYKELAEINSDTLFWEKHIESIHNLAYNLEHVNGNNDEAIEILSKALDINIMKLGGTHKLVPKTKFLISLAYQYKGNYSLSYEFLESAINIQHQILGKDSTDLRLGSYYVTKGLVNNYLGRYDNVLKDYETALAIFKDKLGEKHSYIATIYNNIGLYYWDKASYDLGQEYLEKALDIYKVTIGENNVNVATTYRNIGNIHWYRDGAFNLAMEYYMKSLTILQNIYKVENADVGMSYNGIGMLYYEKKEYQLGLENLKKAIKIYKATIGEKHDWSAITYDNIGSVYMAQESYDLAYDFLVKSLTIKEEVLEKDHLDIAYSYQQIGEVLTLKESYNRALESHKKALAIRKRNLGSKNFYVTESYNYIGDIYQIMGKYQKALKAFQMALYSNLTNFNDNTNIYQNPVLDSYYGKNQLLESLQSKAITLTKIGSQKNLDFALETYLLCDSLIDRIRYSQLSSTDKIELGKTSKQIYNEAVQLSYKLYENTNEEKYITNAFYFSEKSKSSVLRDRVSEINAKQFANIPDSLLEKEINLKSDISFYKSKEQELELEKDVKDSTKVNYFKNKIFALNREREELIKLFEDQFPAYFQLKYNNDQITLSQVQKRLKDNESLVEYFLGDSINYAFLITMDKALIYPIRKANNLSEEIKNIQISLKEENFDSYSKIAYKLYETLIQPLKLKKPNIIIIPDGELWYLNFDILLKEKPQESDFKSCKYLILDYTIQYANSASLIFSENQKVFDVAKNECLAFSYSNSNKITDGNYISMRGEGGLSDIDLPGSRKEIKAISEVIKGSYYFGSYANEKNFKQNAKNYKILHLALHGEIDENNPLNSKLYFTNNQDSLEDNLLYAHELYNLELNAELAVLSACNTGTGQMIKGEGIMSLGRAFKYAGCKSLLLTQWELSDQFTPGIMKSFYSNLQNGSTKSEALRDAKLAYLGNSSSISANPYFWAPLVQLGDNAPLPQKNYMIWVIAGFVIVSVLVSSYTILKRKSS